jgi:hypothetical protein
MAIVAACTLLLPDLGALAAPVGTDFTYNGQIPTALTGNGPATGTYDLQFRLYDAPMAGAQIGATLQRTGVPVASGSFTISLDFGDVFSGQSRWLEFGVRQTGTANPFVTASTRQSMTMAPYALGVRLPLNESVSSNTWAVAVTNSRGGQPGCEVCTHLNGAGLFQITNAQNTSSALLATTTGSGPVVEGSSSNGDIGVVRGQNLARA